VSKVIGLQINVTLQQKAFIEFTLIVSRTVNNTKFNTYLTWYGNVGDM
jgi:hypothetical protein